ncbi:Hypothetical predicted protein [Cloeon dipterum]|uniref:Transmembrane protein n=1 Tax=Cloeon dipterum TaxID=197152 RepID=A0A8S1DW15_9INSE|nr:Hypothetical predicted protein [Cloeon dipterum]
MGDRQTELFIYKYTEGSESRRIYKFNKYGFLMFLACSAVSFLGLLALIRCPRSQIHSSYNGSIGGIVFFYLIWALVSLVWGVKFITYAWIYSVVAMLVSGLIIGYYFTEKTSDDDVSDKSNIV